MKNDKKIALVTGPNGGIGAAICKLLESDGLEVITAGNYRDGNACPDYVVDLSDIDAIDSLNEISQVDVVVHTASICPSSPLLTAPISDFDLSYKLNVLCPVKLLQLFAPKMEKGGNFVFISSINGARSCPNLAAYASSKAALNNLTQTAAEELAPQQIRVNAVAPASVNTPMLNSSFERADDPELARKNNALRHPLARLGEPEDVANLVSFLVSDKSSWITGGVHFVDGGAHITRR